MRVLYREERDTIPMSLPSDMLDLESVSAFIKLRSSFGIILTVCLRNNDFCVLEIHPTRSAIKYLKCPLKEQQSEMKMCVRKTRGVY